MGSVSSTSSALLTLLQNVATASPQFSSILSQPGVQSALQNASPGDLAALSDQAVQLQQMSALFWDLERHPVARVHLGLGFSFSRRAGCRNSDAGIQSHASGVARFRWIGRSASQQHEQLVDASDGGTVQRPTVG